MKPRYTLYTQPIQLETLHIVRYLYHLNIHVLPTVVVERGHPRNILLPSIYNHDTNELYEGLEECVRFYEQMSGVSDIMNLAKEFHESHPDDRIFGN